MNKIFTLFLVFFSFLISSNAQCPANDSVSMGSQTANDVYYKLGSGVVATASNQSWHLGFSVQKSQFPTNPAIGVSIRLNSAGLGLNLVKLNGANASNWRSIDTTGMYALPQLMDSDSTYNLSAFTTGYAYPSFDFKWGTYNTATKNVDGTNVFILYNVTKTWYKKIFIKRLAFDTLWDVIVSDLNNGDSTNFQISKNKYPTKLFVYYNTITKQIIDREPAKTAWDLQWTKYLTYVKTQMGSGFYPSVGILTNPAVTAEQNNGKKCNQVWLANKTSKPSPSISTIGSDWKIFTGTTYLINDTLVYFVKGQNGKIYKMSIKGYVTGSQGKTSFNIYEATLGLNDLVETSNINIYPNPNNGTVYVNSASENISSISVTDMFGKTVYSSSENTVLDLNSLSNGMYILLINTADGGVHQKRLIKQ